MVTGMSLLLPDTGALRARARRIHEVAFSTRLNGERLRRQLAVTEWSGPAARAFEVQAEIVLGALRTAAERLDDAAEALRAHAEAVDHAVSIVGSVLEAGWDVVTGAVGSALDLVGL
jgi:uncharacterized protein YukE